MIDTLPLLRRRQLAVETATQIIRHPEFATGDSFPLQMISIIDKALEKWETQRETVV